ncbi:MAG: RNA-binding cell elongation regulator Jag/EloR [Thermodesulfobacteriota bacterium]
MPIIEFEGKTTEEAMEKACNQLHVTPDQLKFEIISAGSSGIFGLGGKKASIRVTVEEKITRKPEPPAEEHRPGRPMAQSRPHRPERPERFERPERAERPYRPRREAAVREDRRPARRPPFEPAVSPQPPQVPENMPLPPTVAGPGEEFYSGPEDEIMGQARQVLEGILTRMDIGGAVQVRRINDRIILSVTGDNSGLLIGKKGATLDALQFLLNKVINRTRSEKHRIIVDTESYRERRHQSLIDLAHRMADKAKRNRRPVTISQLSAHDRRVVHLALQEKPGLKTRSRGDGPLKNVIIIPGGRKADGREFEDRKDLPIMGEPEGLPEEPVSPEDEEYFE